MPGKKQLYVQHIALENIFTAAYRNQLPEAACRAGYLLAAMVAMKKVANTMHKVGGTEEDRNLGFVKAVEISKIGCQR